MINLPTAILIAVILGTLVLTLRVMSRASKGYDRAKQRRAERGPQIPCSTCHSTMTFAGLQELVSGPGPLHPPDPTGTVELEVYRCPTCRKVEFFAPPAMD